MAPLKTIDAGSLFTLHATHGFSLTDSLFQARRDSVIIINWSNWFKAAKAAGWDFDRALGSIEEAVADSCWPTPACDILRTAFSEALAVCR